MKRATLVMGLMLLVAAGLFYVRVRFVESEGETCLRCRLYRVERRLSSFRWYSKPVPNVCSKWYEQNLPAHSHEWRFSGDIHNYEGVGNMGSDPVFMVEPDKQVEYLRSATPVERERWFKQMDSKNPEEWRRAIRMADPTSVYLAK